nr:MAG TPA: hypothetical protein [Crassvirales sp.]
MEMCKIIVIGIIVKYNPTQIILSYNISKQKR